MSEAEKPQSAATGSDAPAPAAAEQAAVSWDDSKMATFFANIVNIQSTGDQVDIFFGTNKTWNVRSDREVKIELNGRAILTPHTAKRMWLALGKVIEEHEKRYGTLNVTR
jgi:hypothetical protein